MAIWRRRRMLLFNYKLAQRLIEDYPPLAGAGGGSTLSKNLTTNKKFLAILIARDFFIMYL